jgi:hypothetical protein
MQRHDDQLGHSTRIREKPSQAYGVLEMCLAVEKVQHRVPRIAHRAAGWNVHVDNPVLVEHFRVQVLGGYDGDGLL